MLGEDPTCPPLREADDGSCIREVVLVVRVYPKGWFVGKRSCRFLFFLHVIVAFFLDPGGHVGGE